MAGIRRAVAAGFVVAALAATSSACTALSPWSNVAPQEADDWVVVTFGGTADRFDLDVLDSLFSTENAADEALQGAGAGWLDGNEIGDHQYDVYFTGYDSEVMWSIIGPIFAGAPAEWTRIELRDGLNDMDATVFTP
jgi:hypothetical protein